MNYRILGEPSPLAAATQDDTGLVAPIAFDQAVAGVPELDAPPRPTDPIDLGDGAPPWLNAAARLIRPLSIGALMAIPTVGTASVGFVAMIDPARGMAMAQASVAFLAGLPLDIVLLIGTLATGYGFAKSIERIKGA